jgi:hypothetical protein
MSFTVQEFLTHEPKALAAMRDVIDQGLCGDLRESTDDRMHLCTRDAADMHVHHMSDTHSWTEDDDTDAAPHVHYAYDRMIPGNVRCQCQRGEDHDK